MSSLLEYETQILSYLNPKPVAVHVYRHLYFYSGAKDIAVSVSPERVQAASSVPQFILQLGLIPGKHTEHQV